MADAAMPSAAEPEDKISRDDQDQWPDWRISQATSGELARYVNPAYAAGWVPTDLLSPLRTKALSGARKIRAAQLYESLAARRVPYASAPWNPAAYDLEGKTV